MASKESYPHSAAVFAAICAFIFAIFGVFGNLLTLLALLRHKKLRAHTPTTFVISLSVCDLLFCSFVLPMQSLRFYEQRWPFGEILCQIFPTILYYSIGVSLLNMVGITINRLILLVCSNRLYTSIYKRNYLILQLLGIWLIPLLLLLPVILGFYGYMGLNEVTFTCTILKGKDGKSFKKILLSIGFVLPCLVVIVSYLWIYVKFVRKRKIERAAAQFHNPGSTMTLKDEKEDYKLTVMMVLRFSGFIICFLPLMLARVFDDESSTNLPWFHVVGSVMAWASTIINPIIYALSNHSYRQAYRELLQKCRFKHWRRRDQHSNSSIARSSTQYSKDFSGEFLEFTSVNFN